MDRLRKYPRTPHLAGSRLQPGDEGVKQMRFAEVAGRHLVVEEKVDGANAAVSFSADGKLLLQSRGHYLTGGPRERQFDLFKSWASCHEAALGQVLGARYVMYGEWAFAKHTIFYDALPHYFLEFDIVDRETGRFLSTPRREALLAGTPVRAVTVLHAGEVGSEKALHRMIGTSRHKSAAWRDRLLEAAAEGGVDRERARRETDPSEDMEGLYIKIENEDHVLARAKYIRRSFLTGVIASETHWLDRPIMRNGLAEGVDIFAA